MMQILGKVEIRVLDANTLEVLDVVEQDNVITSLFYNRWITTPYSSIATTIILSADTAPSYEDWSTIVKADTSGFIPSGVITPQLFPAVGAVPPYVQFMRRFNPPITTRNINTIALSDTSSTTTFSANVVMAYVKLLAPCTQTPSQILDVYYRVQAVSSGSYSYNFYNQNPGATLQALFTNNGPILTFPSNTGIVPTYGHVSIASNIAPTDMGAMFPNFSACNDIGDSGATISSIIENQYGNITRSWAYSISNGVGDIHGSISLCYAQISPSFAVDIRPVMTTVNIVAPNNSPIQPIFSHAASTLSSTTANPFLDSLPTTGTGVVNIDGTWETGHLPELYKINIVTGGTVGVATYQFAVRNHFGFLGSLYLSNAQSLPAAYNFTLSGITVAKPHTAGNFTADSGVGGYGTRINRYDDIHMLSHDSTGISKYNITDHSLVMFDNTTTPVLAATNIRQIAVKNSDGSIWIACANTGIYRINAAGDTITNFTTANGLPSNNCYALDIGRNNAIWALCGGGVVTSGDDGVTWTTYNSGTTPAFNSPILNADWSSVQYMKVDPTNINDRMLFVRNADCALNNTVGGIWWDRGTGVAVNHTGLTVAGNFAIPRRTPTGIDVSDNDGFWAAYNGGSINYKLTYGTSTTNSIGITCVMSPIFVRDINNTQDLLVSIEAVNAGSGIGGTLLQGGGGTSRFTTNLYNTSLVVVSTTTPPSPPTKVISNAAIASGLKAVYMGNGIIAGYNTNVYGQFGVIMSISGDGTPSGGPHEYLIWKKYGWDGANWVLNNAGAKTTHTTDQPIIHSLNTKFTNGATGTSFITGDYYTGSVNDGILKNNAMTMSGSQTTFVLPTQRLTNFDGVVRTYPWTTGLASWRKISASLTANIDGSLTNNIPYRSYRLSAGSKNRVFGDFSISGTFTANVNQYYNVGISTEYKTELNANIVTTNSTWSFLVTGNILQVVNSAGGNVVTAPAISGTIPWNISRVGNTLSFSTSGVVRYTTVDSSYSFLIRAVFNDTTTGTNAFTINPITIDSSGTGYYTGLGNSGTGTGVYNTKQLVATLSTAGDISLDGTPLTILNLTPATTPAAGTGVSLAREEGLLFFNSGDVGKTVSGSYTMCYQASTPTGVIPA